MAKRKEIKLSDISDPFVYYNGKNYVYCGPFSKTGYILSNSDAKAYTVYSTRYFIPLSLGIVAFFIGLPWYIALAAFIGFQIFMSLMFRKKLLANLPVIDNFEKPGRNISIFDKVASKYTKKELLLPLICSILLVIIIPINAINQNYQDVMLYGNYAVAGLMALVSLFFLICLIKAKGSK